MIITNSNQVIADGTKLKDYLQDAINEISNDYVDIDKNNTINVIDTLEYIRKYRNILLCINEICKERNKY